MSNRNNIFSFENLKVYQEARELVKDIYQLLTLFPREEQWALCDQLRRSVTSIVSNIAEGLGRIYDKEQKHFISTAFGSLVEVYCQIQIAQNLKYITKEDYDKICERITLIAKLLSGLRNSLDKTNTNNPDGSVNCKL